MGSSKETEEFTFLELHPKAFIVDILFVKIRFNDLQVIKESGNYSVLSIQMHIKTHNCVYQVSYTVYANGFIYFYIKNTKFFNNVFLGVLKSHSFDIQSSLVYFKYPETTGSCLFQVARGSHHCLSCHTN